MPAMKSQAVTYGDPGDEREPPFGTPPTMTVRAVADFQNRLFWCVGTGLGLRIPPLLKILQNAGLARLTLLFA
jgi:hypothetical protein